MEKHLLGQHVQPSLPPCEGALMLHPSLSSHDQCCQWNLPMLPEAEVVLATTVYM